MLNTLICGSGSFHSEDEEAWSSPCATPRRWRKNSLGRRQSKNPYSSRGLDKFSALLSDLEEKRQRIYSQLGSQEEAPLVRFVYSPSNDCVPIVVKLKDNKTQEKTKNDEIKENCQERSQTESSAAVPQVKKETKLEVNTKKRILSWRWGRPEYYFPAAMILILVFLAVFGRSAAVLCTSLGWYLVPTLQGESSHVRKSTKKKQYITRLSDKKMGKSAGSSPPNRSSSLHRSHRKSF